MIKYNPKLKEEARRLRAQMTDSERALWARLRRKQVQSVQFYTQKPIGNYIVDFYAPKAKLVVEVVAPRTRIASMQQRTCGETPTSRPRDCGCSGSTVSKCRGDRRSDGSDTEGGGGIARGKSPLTPLCKGGEGVVALPERSEESKNLGAELNVGPMRTTTW